MNDSVSQDTAHCTEAWNGLLCPCDFSQVRQEICNAMDHVIFINATAGWPGDIEIGRSSRGYNRRTGGDMCQGQEKVPNAVTSSSNLPKLMATIRVYGSILYATHK